MSRTIFMIHGMFGGSWCWDPYRAFFEARGYTCLTPVLRHHGVAPGDPPHPALGTTSLLDYAADLEQEIRLLPEPPILMGHSMGGLIAQLLAGRELGSAAVLLAPAAPAGILAVRPSVLKSVQGDFLRWGFWKRPVKVTFASTCYSSLHLVPEEEQRAIYRRFVHESGRACFEIGLWPLDPRRASRVDETRVRIPVLVLCGTEDRITPASVARRIVLKYRRTAAYMEFPNHAHWIIGEPGWEGVASHIDLWLKQTGALPGRLPAHFPFTTARN